MSEPLKNVCRRQTVQTYQKYCWEYHIYCPNMNKLRKNNDRCHFPCSGSTIPSMFGNVCLQMEKKCRFHRLKVSHPSNLMPQTGQLHQLNRKQN